MADDSRSPLPADVRERIARGLRRESVLYGIMIAIGFAAAAACVIGIALYDATGEPGTDRALAVLGGLMGVLSAGALVELRVRRGRVARLGRALAGAGGDLAWVYKEYSSAPLAGVKTVTFCRFVFHFGDGKRGLLMLPEPDVDFLLRFAVAAVPGISSGWSRGQHDRFRRDRAGFRAEPVHGDGARRLVRGGEYHSK